MNDRGDSQRSSTEDTCHSALDPRAFAEGGARHSVFDIHGIYGRSPVMVEYPGEARSTLLDRYPSESRGHDIHGPLRQSRSFTPGPSFIGVSRS